MKQFSKLSLLLTMGTSLMCSEVRAGSEHFTAGDRGEVRREQERLRQEEAERIKREAEAAAARAAAARALAIAQKAAHDAAVAQINNEALAEFATTKAEIESKYSALDTEWTQKLKDLNREVLTQDLVDALHSELKEYVDSLIENRKAVTLQKDSEQSSLSADTLGSNHFNSLTGDLHDYKQRVRISMNKDLRLYAQSGFLAQEKKRANDVQFIVATLLGDGPTKELVTNLKAYAAAKL